MSERHDATYHFSVNEAARCAICNPPPAHPADSASLPAEPHTKHDDWWCECGGKLDEDGRCERAAAEPWECGQSEPGSDYQCSRPAGHKGMHRRRLRAAAERPTASRQGLGPLDVERWREACADAHVGWYLWEQSIEYRGTKTHAKEWGDCQNPTCRSRLAAAYASQIANAQETSDED